VKIICSQHARFSLLPHETLLEALERTGHEVEYHCRAGFCGACRLRILDGEVRYLEQPLAFISSDEVLPCCCVPESDLRIDCELRLDMQNLQIQDDMFPAQQSLFDEPLVIPELGSFKKISRKITRKNSVRLNNLSLF